MSNQKNHASITRTDSKQSNNNNNQNKQEIQGKINVSKSGITYNKYYTRITKYDERIYGKIGRNV